MEENISMYRICRKCGRKLPLSELAKNKNCKYGRTYTCYECSKRKYHENYLRKLEKEGCKPYWENKNLISFRDTQGMDIGAKSIAFDKMSEAEFDKLYEAVLDVIFKVFLENNRVDKNTFYNALKDF